MFVHRTVALRTFERLGINYMHAEDGQEAVRIVLEQGQPFDLIVMDNQMPELSGSATTRRLRELGCKSYILGMTGDPTGCPEREEFEASGTNTVVDKCSGGMAFLEALLAEWATPSEPHAEHKLVRDSSSPLEADAVACLAEDSGSSEGSGSHLGASAMSSGSSS